MVGPFTNTVLQIYCWVCLERIFKISRYLAKFLVRKLTASSAVCAGHCPAERWRIHLSSNAWWVVTVITASCYDNSPTITLTPWSTSIKLVFWTTCDSSDWCLQWLSERWSCAHLSWCFSSWLLQLHIVGDSFGLMTSVNICSSANKIVLTLT